MACHCAWPVAYYCSADSGKAGTATSSIVQSEPSGSGIRLAAEGSTEQCMGGSSTSNRMLTYVWSTLAPVFDEDKSKTLSFILVVIFLSIA